jgi:hypothetical protein
MIIGIFGACRRQELHQLQFDDVKDLGSQIIVTLHSSKTKKPRTFTIAGKYLALVQKYINLRPQHAQTKSFFVNYQKGKCTCQNVGINKVGDMGKIVATYLNLPDPNQYTGHCFRRSSATLLVDGGGDILTLKRHGGWKLSTVAESYVDESNNKLQVSNQMLENYSRFPSSSGIAKQTVCNICIIHNLYSKISTVRSQVGYYYYVLNVTILYTTHCFQLLTVGVDLLSIGTSRCIIMY